MTLRAALVFVVGCTPVFTALGVSFALVGSALLRNVPLIMRAAVVLIILMGLATTGLLRLPSSPGSGASTWPASRPGRGAPSLWAWPSPSATCIGRCWPPWPARRRHEPWPGRRSFLCSTLGLGIPILLLALGFSRAPGSLTWLRRHGREVVGGAMLVGVGVLFVSGAWRSFFTPFSASSPSSAGHRSERAWSPGSLPIRCPA